MTDRNAVLRAKAAAFALGAETVSEGATSGDFSLGGADYRGIPPIYRFLFHASYGCVPPPEARRYYESVIATVGKEETLAHARYFLVPGQDHSVSLTRHGDVTVNGEHKMQRDICILSSWVENGIAPTSLTLATERYGVRVEKTIFAY